MPLIFYMSLAMFTDPEVVSPGPQFSMSTQRKYFKHFHSDLIYTELMNVCRLLGHYGKLSCDNRLSDTYTVLGGNKLQTVQTFCSVIERLDEKLLCIKA